MNHYDELEGVFVYEDVTAVFYCDDCYIAMRPRRTVPAAEQSVQWTLLESPRFEVVSCQCGLCKGTHTTIPQSH
jgi:hypothetical protein